MLCLPLLALGTFPNAQGSCFGCFAFLVCAGSLLNLCNHVDCWVMSVFSATHRPHTSPCLWVACCGHLVVLPPTGPRYHRATLCCLAQLSWGSCHAASLPCSMHPLLAHSSGSFEERTTFVPCVVSRFQRSSNCVEFCSHSSVC